MLDSRWAAARNLLLMRLDNIGDVVLLSAALRTLREELPGASITLMASPSGALAAPLLPWLDDLLVWRALWQDAGGRMPLDPAREMELVDLLRERDFDAAIIFTSFSQSPHGAAHACYLAGIPLRLGESKEFGGGLLTTEVRTMPDHIYQSERALRLLESVGFRVQDRRPEVVIPSGARETARTLLSDRGVDLEGPYLVVQPGASCQARRYPMERYSAVVGMLAHRLEMPVLLAGSGKEAPTLAGIASRWSPAAMHAGNGGVSSDGPRVVSIAGDTRVEELAAVIEQARLVVCNNSLPMHLAATLKVPSVVLFSGTEMESQWVSPYGPATVLRRETSCSPCYRFECPFNLECLEFTPEAVAEAVERMLMTVGGSR